MELSGLVTTDSAGRIFKLQHDDGLIEHVVTGSDSDSDSLWGVDEIDWNLSKNSVEIMSPSILVAGVIGNSEELESDRS